VVEFTIYSADVGLTALGSSWFIAEFLVILTECEAEQKARSKDARLEEVSVS
jgi:hypothetical protein